jgi:hypothetical protein
MTNLEDISLAGLLSGVLDLAALFNLGQNPWPLVRRRSSFGDEPVVVPLSAASKREF